MLRNILVGAVSGFAGGVIGFYVGTRAGFDAGVRDYLENDAEMLEHVADSKEKFDYETDESVPERSSSQGFQ